jgi:hypothetical protein
MAIDEKTGSSSKCRELNSENVVVALYFVQKFNEI